MKWFWRKGEQKRQAPEKQEKMAAPQHKQETHSRDWQERMALWEQERLKREGWLKEHPAQEAQFFYLRDMLSLDVLSFYNPSNGRYGGMDEDKNKTGGVWMRTPPVYDLEQVTRLYQRLRDAGDDLGPEELRYAPDEVRRTVEKLGRHRRLYLRLCSERQLTALGVRKDAFLNQCRKEDIHLFLQRSRNVIQSLTDSMDYEIHVEKTERDPLTGKETGGEITLCPAKEPEEVKGARGDSEGREKHIDEEIRQMFRANEERLRQKLFALAQTLEPDSRLRLERAVDAFFCRMFWGVRPQYVKELNVDDVFPVRDCFAVSAEADLNDVLDTWQEIRAAANLSPEIAWYFRELDYHGGAPAFLLDDASQLERSTGGKSALIRRCQEYGASFMLNLGDGYYQSLPDGSFYKLAVGETEPGSADDAATYGKLDWMKIGPLPAAPPIDQGSRGCSI
ncbi:MAG TPA: hypothetical protein H9931_08370 [Candidatus Enterocloster excrementigallinarum]|uniref:Uncharacterized protein n=1 Tax=Candidatus Enterocloster excrementigallinarum TaxID=2838558 RepID=A0A9D2TFC1_9FIRM|nr:hypothetical protein [Candidatus Enterocloster excrementigallinarum]